MDSIQHNTNIIKYSRPLITMPYLTYLSLLCDRIKESRYIYQLYQDNIPVCDVLMILQLSEDELGQEAFSVLYNIRRHNIYKFGTVLPSVWNIVKYRGQTHTDKQISWYIDVYLRDLIFSEYVEQN